jgi:hypothetical protein
MQRRERAKLAVYLEKQGGVVRKTNAGFLALNPVTRKTISWHSAASSDVRGWKNLRKDVVGAGFTWPNI